MAVGTGGRDGIGCIEHAVLIFGLIGLIRLHSCVAQALNEHFPIRIVDGHGASVATFAAWDGEQVRGFGHHDPAVFDGRPSAIGALQRIRCGAGIGGRFDIGGVLALSRKDDVRIRKQDAAHDLSKRAVDLCCWRL